MPPGGTLRLLAQSAPGTIDPQINYTGQAWQLLITAYDGLVALRKVAGPDGNQVVPDLAEALPVIDQGGLRYEFRLRRGLRFSDGSALRASDAAASLRRLFRIGSPTAGSFYGNIAGAQACLDHPEGCLLEGVSADDAAATLTIRLSRPDPELLFKLSLPHASILPAAAPDHDSGTVPLPGTGPYLIESYQPSSHLRLVRNPQFHLWSRDAQPEGGPDVIEERFGLEDEAEVTQVERGEADWMFDTPPADRLGELGARFADRVRLNLALALWYLPLNVHEPPFDDVRVRRAFDLAIDRDAIARLAGGPRLATPACRILPPGIEGHVDAGCPYDPAQARALVAASGTAGQRVTLVIDTSAMERAIGTYVISMLADLGYDARLRALSGNIQFAYIQNSGNHVQVSLTSWSSDYPAPSDFLPTLFGCAAFHPNSDSSVNMSGFCDPALDARSAAALAMPAGPERAAAWAGIDQALGEVAPAVVLFNPAVIDLISRHVGHYVSHAQYHWLADQSCLRAAESNRRTP